MYEVHRSAVEGQLSGANLRDFNAILNNDATEGLYLWSLKNLTQWLHQVHGVRPIVLIDEYDAGIHASHTNGFYKEAIGFLGGAEFCALRVSEAHGDAFGGRLGGPITRWDRR